MRAILALAAWCLLAVAATARAETNEEYVVKASYLLNISNFVTWPADAPSDERHTFVVTILGTDPFGPVLDRLAGKGVKGRQVEIRRLAVLDSSPRCHILFISQSERHRLDPILQAMGGRPVLTVSDIDGFARRGGSIGFVRVADRIRFEINADAAQRVGLRIGSQLLNLAVNGGGQ